VGLVTLAISAFVTALSGALMPGPVLFVTVRHGAAGGRWAGPLVVLGHAVVEIPLMLAIVLGLGELLRSGAFVGAVGLAGGGVLLVMAGGMLRSLPNLKLPGQREAAGGDGPDSSTVVAAGALTSLSNPYFFVWWATMGMRFLAGAAAFGMLGYVVFYCGHVLADLAWYAAVGESMHRGRRLLSNRVYRWLVGVLAVALAGFAVYFAADGAWRLLG
jgi:threonine/homoserine/homoserine lactone efflux protein